ncbi:MAG: hypothetical protein C3F07_08965 [Anaerolineales bacterium]|nr:histidine phosphatase family protein [Anaerolineae bacterium]PWB73852.1 MAG: hypothetical protein C3F07_08965 [Anaerolineales bacterium]
MAGKHLILVKHSIPVIVENLPAREWRLSSEGRSRALKLTGQLSVYSPEVIISSNEPKAMETAEILAREYGLKFLVVDGLHEHDRRNVPFQSMEEFRRSVRQFFERPRELVFGNETAEQSNDRFAKAVHSVVDSHEAETIVIVSHGTVISQYVSRLVGCSAYSLWEELGLPSYVVLDMERKFLLKKATSV